MSFSRDMTLSCCNDDQYRSIFLVILYSVLILKLWRIVILHPFKLLTVFLHELGHAIAAWITCGKVVGMEVHPNEGGSTRTVGGCQLVILPAGYIGSAIWGMGLMIASASVLGSQIASGILLFFLFICIIIAQNKYLRLLNLGFIAFLGIFLAISFQFNVEILQYITLFIGVMSCLFSIYDIWDDLISRRVNASDATIFAEITHTSSRCWGVIWGLIAICALTGAVYFHLLVLQHTSASTDSDFSTETQVVLGLMCVVVGLSIFHTSVTRQCMLRPMEAAPEETYDAA